MVRRCWWDSPRFLSKPILLLVCDVIEISQSCHQPVLSPASPVTRQSLWSASQPLWMSDCYKAVTIQETTLRQVLPADPHPHEPPPPTTHSWAHVTPYPLTKPLFNGVPPVGTSQDRIRPDTAADTDFNILLSPVLGPGPGIREKPLCQWPSAASDLQPTPSQLKPFSQSLFQSSLFWVEMSKLCLVLKQCVIGVNAARYQNSSRKFTFTLI